MLVSVLIPVRDAVATLPPLLKSFEALPRELLPSFPELIFVDDASTDGTPRLLFHWGETAFLPVKVLGLDTRSGLSVALREGLQIAAGDAVIPYLTRDAVNLSSLAGALAAVRDGGAHVAWPRSRPPLGLRALLYGIGARHGVPADHRAELASLLSVWRKTSLEAALGNGKGLDAIVEAHLRSQARGDVRQRVLESTPYGSPSFPSMATATRWLVKSPFNPL